MKLYSFLKRMSTSLQGGISSKIVIGAASYLLLNLVVAMLCFFNPKFPELSSIIKVLIVTSGGLLGLTTIENIKK